MSSPPKDRIPEVTPSPSNVASIYESTSTGTPAIVPLLVPVKKKPGLKKPRVRPKSVKRKAGSINTTVPSSSTAAAAAAANTIDSSGVTITGELGNKVAKIASSQSSPQKRESDDGLEHNTNEKDDHDGGKKLQEQQDQQPLTSSTTIASSLSLSSPNKTNNVKLTSSSSSNPNKKPTTKVQLLKNKPSRPSSASIRKSTPIRPSSSSTNKNINSAKGTSTSIHIRKGLGISVGSTMLQRNTSKTAKTTITQPTKQKQPSTGKDISTTITATNDTVTTETATTTASSKSSSSDTNNIITNHVEIIPYQHLGQLDPAWNIPVPKAGEKTMKDFCSKFKRPKEEKVKSKNQEQENIIGSAARTGVGVNSNNNTNASENNTNENNPQTNTNDNNNNNSNFTNNNNPPTDTLSQEAQDANRSGPLVEEINGEIVIKHSSIIVGGRRTTEEVDRELELVVEDNTGITATYLSFTNREKNVRWTIEETKHFYFALRQCGTDFSTMSSFFDGSDDCENIRKRSRKQLKNKYKQECKKNMKLIDMAMNPKVQLPLDLTVFGELDFENVGKNIGSVDKTGPTSSATGANENDDVIMMDNPVTVDTDTNTSRENDNTTPTIETPESMTPVTTLESNDEINNHASSTTINTTKINDETMSSITPPLPIVVTTNNVETEQKTKKQPEKEKAKALEVNNIPLTLGGGMKKKKQKPKFKAVRGRGSKKK